MPARHSTPARPPATQRGHERVPRLAGGDLQRRAVAGDAARGDADHGAREALVGDDDVRAAREHEQRLAGLVGGPDGPHEVLLVEASTIAGGGAAQAQGRQLAEAHGASG